VTPEDQAINVQDRSTVRQGMARKIRVLRAHAQGRRKYRFMIDNATLAA